MGSQRVNTTGRLNSDIFVCVCECSRVHTCVGFPLCTHVCIYVYVHTCTCLWAASINSRHGIPVTQQPHSEHAALSHFYSTLTASVAVSTPASSLVLGTSWGSHSLILTLTPWRMSRPPQTKDSIPQGCPLTSDATTSPAIIRGSRDPFLGSVPAGAVHTSRPTVLLLFEMCPEGTGWNRPTARMHGLASTSAHSRSGPLQASQAGSGEAASSRQLNDWLLVMCPQEVWVGPEAPPPRATPWSSWIPAPTLKLLRVP